MKIKNINLPARFLIISIILAINSYAVEFPWKRSGESKVSIEEALKQIEDLKSENEKCKIQLENNEDYAKQLKTEKQRSEEISKEVIELQTKIQITSEVLKIKETELQAANTKAKEASELQIKLLSANEILKAKEAELQSKIQEGEGLQVKLKDFFNKIPRHILKKYGIHISAGPDMFGRVRTVLSILIFCLFLFIILLAMSHSHRKGDFISWLNQKVWGKKLVSTISQYGIVFFCIYEIAVNIPTVQVIVDNVLNWIVMGP